MDVSLRRLKKLIDCIPIGIALVLCCSGSLLATSFSDDDQGGIVVKGHVTSSEDQTGLPGVNVIIKGTAIGTVTDSNGDYSLEVPSTSSVIVFTYIGFTSTEIPVGSQSVIDVPLAADSKALEEIVVVGYGTQRKVDLTGAVATFNSDQVKERPLVRVDQALVGQMAGVRVQQTSGVPGRGFSIQVRGTGSISANTEPLYVIDGFPLEPSAQNGSGTFSTGNPLDNINPNDIESIQVLKDAASAAIYGSRASNGVVIIKTKSGQDGAKPKIAFSVYTGVSQVQRKMEMLNAEQWVDRAKEWINGNWVALGGGRTASQTTAQRLAQQGGTINANLMIDDRWDMPGHPGLEYVDWQDLMFRTAPVTNYELSATGGNDAVKYFVSGGYLNQDGISIGVNYKRFSSRANVEVKASDKLKFGVNLAPTYSMLNDPGVDGKDALTHVAVSLAPIVEDNIGGPQNTNVGTVPNYFWGQSGRINPVAVLNKQTGTTNIFRILSTIYGEYEIIKNLSLRSSINFDNEDGTSKRWTPAEITGTVTSRATTGALSGFRRQNFVNENTLTFSKKIQDHSFTVLAGQSYNTFKYDNWNINAPAFSSDDVSTLNFASTTSGTSTETKSVLISYFGRVQYSFTDRYLLTASIRRDGSSRFGSNTKWGTFPSFSAGWRISEENFLKNATDIFSDLKLRVSWGVSGNNAFGNDYGSIAVLQASNTSFGFNGSGALAKGASLSNSAAAVGYPNPNLKWETSTTTNFGLDVGVIQNRVHASFDYYIKNNEDLLLNIPIPAAAGYGAAASQTGATALTNIGQVLNHGIEIELHTRNLVGAFQWSTDINVSHNTNEIKKLGPNNTPIYSNGGFDIEHKVNQVGLPMNTLYLIQQDGLLSQADLNAGYPLFGTQKPGDPKYIDANGDGVINANDRVLSGPTYPNYTYGMTNTFKYKGFDLNILIQGQTGGQIYSLFGRAVDRSGQGYMDNTIAKYADRWRSEADPGNGSHKQYTTQSFIKNTDWLYSSDYMRVRNITLGYNLAPLIKSKVIAAARVYVTAENWFGYDKYSGGFNPDAVNTNGEDYGSFPLAKTLILGVNMTF